MALLGVEAEKAMIFILYYFYIPFFPFFEAWSKAWWERGIDEMSGMSGDTTI